MSSSRVELWKESGKKCESERPKRSTEKGIFKGFQNGKSVGKSEKEVREGTTQCRVGRERILQGCGSGSEF